MNPCPQCGKPTVELERRDLDFCRCDPNEVISIWEHCLILGEEVTKSVQEERSRIVNVIKKLKQQRDYWILRYKKARYLSEL